MYCGREGDQCEQELWHEQGLASCTKENPTGGKRKGFGGWTKAVGTGYDSGAKTAMRLMENRRTWWTSCRCLWEPKGINRYDVVRAVWKRSSFGNSALGWEQNRGPWWSERLYFQAGTGRDNVGSESQKKSKHTQGWRSLCTSDSISLWPRKGSAQSSSRAGRCSAAEPCGCGSLLLSELRHCPWRPWLIHCHHEGPVPSLATPGPPSWQGCWVPSKLQHLLRNTNK